MTKLSTPPKLIAIRCRLKAAFREGRNAAFRRQMLALRTLRTKTLELALLACLLSFSSARAFAAHNVLTSAERCDGSLPLFDGKNAEKVNHIDLDQFTKPNKCPDGTPHKFDIAYRNHPRRGYIGLQDHGADCWFKNIKLKPLN